MNKLIHQIETVRTKLDGWRKREFNEQQTRVTVIDPMLDALGWDTREPDEVEHGQKVVGGTFFDYALRLDGRRVLVIEAKPVGDSLVNEKDITQAVNYANSEGIEWCILTNGIKWKVYRSMEKCRAPDKLMREVSLDLRDAGMTVRQIAEQMWPFSRDEMARGTLDKLGEQTFTDAKVRKALDGLMLNPPRPLLNMVKQATNDGNLAPQKVKESLGRIWAEKIGTGTFEPATRIDQKTRAKRKRSNVNTKKSGNAKHDFDEQFHLGGKPLEVAELYRGTVRFCRSLDPDGVQVHFEKKYVGFRKGKRSFCDVIVQRGDLRAFVKLDFNHLTKPPAFVRDVRAIGHHGSSALTTELRISSKAELEQAKELIRQSFETV